MCPGFCHVLLSAGVGAHCGQLAGLGTLPITNTLTAHSSCWSSLEPFLPPFWSPPCTQLRGFSQGCSSQGAEGSAACPTAEGTQEPGLVSLRPPQPCWCQTPSGQHTGGLRAHGHCRLAAAMRKAMKVKAPTACRPALGWNTLWEVLRGNFITQKNKDTSFGYYSQLHKAGPTQEANENCSKWTITWHGNNTQALLFFPIKSLHSQYLNGKAKEGKLFLAVAVSMAPRQVPMLSFQDSVPLLFRGGLWSAEVAGCRGGCLLAACTASPSQAAGREGLLGMLSWQRWSCSRGNFRAEWKTV